MKKLPKTPAFDKITLDEILEKATGIYEKIKDSQTFRQTFDMKQTRALQLVILHREKLCYPNLAAKRLLYDFLEYLEAFDYCLPTPTCTCPADVCDVHGIVDLSERRKGRKVRK